MVNIKWGTNKGYTKAVHGGGEYAERGGGARKECVEGGAQKEYTKRGIHGRSMRRGRSRRKGYVKGRGLHERSTH